MTVTKPKKKITKKNSITFKTKLTKEKIMGKKKDKLIKKKTKIKKEKSIVKGKKLIGKKTKKNTTKGKKKYCNRVSECQSIEETNSEECKEEEMVAEEGGDVAIANNSNKINFESVDMSSDEEEEVQDEGYAESVSEDAPTKTSYGKENPLNKHVVFDDDKTFEDLPVLAKTIVKEAYNEDQEESDSDAPPEEESISMGKDIFAEENVKMKEEIKRLKNQVKEARRLKHQKNREQQMKKRERLETLEKSRLPANLLEAVTNEAKETKTVSIAKRKRKRKKSNKRVDGELITLERGVKVRAVQQVVKKHATIASIAADFRHKALFHKKTLRMPSVDQRMMLVKQQKSGKNLFVS